MYCRGKSSAACTAGAGAGLTKSMPADECLLISRASRERGGCFEQSSSRTRTSRSDSAEASTQPSPHVESAGLRVHIQLATGRRGSSRRRLNMKSQWRGHLADSFGPVVVCVCRAVKTSLCGSWRWSSRLDGWCRCFSLCAAASARHPPCRDHPPGHPPAQELLLA